jgi:hypothetical protein
MELIANAAAKTFEVKAEKLGITKEVIASINLTGEDDFGAGSSNQEEVKTDKVLTAF